jgi:hypothetical protein
MPSKAGGDPVQNGQIKRFAQHNAELGIMQSVFSAAARARRSGCVRTFDPRRWAKNVLD